MSASRIPLKTRPRMDALARLPVFFALEGKRVVLAGGNGAAAWKAELLSAAGAQVDVYAADPGEDMLDIAAQPPRGNVTVHRRSLGPGDLQDAAMAVGAFEDDRGASGFAAQARAAGVPVNVIDKPDHCDFAFGAIVNRSPLVIGVSTDGAAPVFAQAVRAKIEALLPRGFARWAQAARLWRQRVQASGLSFAGRRRFWQLFTKEALLHPDQAPVEADLDDFIAATQLEGADVERGTVTLVGAGPGDPELLTLRAVRALQSADVILIDDLVAPEILDFARREAKKMLVGKTGHGPSCKQEEISRMMVALAKAGKRVVRLKGGDPMIFGRAGEEIDACRAAGIPVEIVPGISAAQGAASRLGVSLTHRKLARRLQYITGHADNGCLPDDIDWKCLVDPTATTIVYMPGRTLQQLSSRAIAEGLDPETPAIAIAQATRPDEKVIAATIGKLSERMAVEAPGGPVLVLIGRALGAYRTYGQIKPAKNSPSCDMPRSAATG